MQCPSGGARGQPPRNVHPHSIRSYELVMFLIPSPCPFSDSSPCLFSDPSPCPIPDPSPFHQAEASALGARG
jgi:hypothetical protein